MGICFEGAPENVVFGSMGPFGAIQSVSNSARKACAQLPATDSQTGFIADSAASWGGVEASAAGSGRESTL